MAHIIAESRFATPLAEDEEKLRAREVDIRLEADGHGSHWLRTFASRDRKRLICEFEAPDAESVRSAYAAAGFPLEDCWPAVIHSSETAQAD